MASKQVEPENVRVRMCLFTNVSLHKVFKQLFILIPILKSLLRSRGHHKV